MNGYSILAISCGLGILVAMVPLFIMLQANRRYWLTGHQTAHLAHELKSPLSIMRGTVELIRRAVQKKPFNSQTLNEYFAILVRNTVRLERFMSNLYKVALIQHGSVRIERQRLRLEDVASQVAEQMEPLLNQKHLKLEKNLKPTPPVYADEKKIAEVITNLLSNAIKYSSSGTIHLSVYPTTKTIRFEIADSGIGLTRYELRHAFDRFYQSHHSDGSGLGLTIAHGWIKGHGGRLHASSEGRNKGSRFWFDLPLT